MFAPLSGCCLYVWVALAISLLAVPPSEGAMEYHFVYFPERELVMTPESFGLRYEEAELKASDGVKLHGWYVPGTPERPVVLFFHGNAGNISHRVENIALLHRLGLGVLIFDYRGYGRSEGVAGEAGINLDARAALAWLEERGLPPARLVYFGRSLGAAVAVQLAAESPPAGLVLETPFTSLRDLGRLHYPLLHIPLGWLVRDRYEVLGKIGGIRTPLLVIQGDRDEIVPESMARRVYEAAPGPKRFYLVRGGDHNATYPVAGEEYWREWREFIAALAPQDGPDRPAAPRPGGGSPQR